MEGAFENMRSRSRVIASARRYVWAIFFPLLATSWGCPQYRDPTVPGEIRKITEPALGDDYFLYVPTTYEADREWALIMVCHGTRWFDTAKRQMGDWSKLAEERQFIVAAPRLQGVNGLLPPAASKQMVLQEADERHILACI